jgi:hypothetical protein
VAETFDSSGKRRRRNEGATAIVRKFRGGSLENILRRSWEEVAAVRNYIAQTKGLLNTFQVCSYAWPM